MSAVPVMTIQDLELEHAELLPARETLWVPEFYPRLYPKGPIGLTGEPFHHPVGIPSPPGVMVPYMAPPRA